MDSEEDKKKVINGALYPDQPTPRRLDTMERKIDFLVRLCGAWDFGRLPDPEVVKEVSRPHWRKAVDACRMLTSPAYHLLRRRHGLPELPYLGRRIPEIADDPNLQHV
ncbi:MAG: hypothetical protein ACLFWL_05340 [Candidatus Brocadiia bacterium]